MECDDSFVVNVKTRLLKSHAPPVFRACCRAGEKQGGVPKSLDFGTPPDWLRFLWGWNQITPCSIIALATFMKPAMLAPFM